MIIFGHPLTRDLCACCVFPPLFPLARACVVCYRTTRCMDWRPDPIVNYIATYLYYGYGFIT